MIYARDSGAGAIYTLLLTANPVREAAIRSTIASRGDVRTMAGANVSLPRAIRADGASSDDPRLNASVANVAGRP